MHPSIIQTFSFSLLSVFAVVRCVYGRTDVALVQFYLWGDKTPTSLTFVGPVMTKGEEDLAPYKDVLNITRVLLYSRNVTTCDEMSLKATFWATRYYYREANGNPVMGIFGPGCPSVALSIAPLARAWNKQMLATTRGTDYTFSNKKRFPTLTNFSPFIDWGLEVFMHRLLDHFSYSTVGILCDDANDYLSIYIPMCSNLFDTMRLTYNFSASRFYVNATDENNVKHYLEEIRSAARVVIIIAHGDRIRPIMLAAFDKQMTEGDYVYFTVELFPSARYFGSIAWDTGNIDKRDADARIAFRSLFKISLRSPDATPEYLNVTDEIKRRSKITFDYTYAAGEEVNPFAMAYYYALAIYGQVLNQAIAFGMNPNDGVSMSRLIWNRTFTVLGQDITLNANGDRDMDWALNQMDIETGIFMPVLEFSAKRNALEVSRDPESHSFRKIVWYKSDSPPPNEPKCGYRGIKPECETEQRNQYQQLVAAVVNLFEVIKGMIA
ncbi:atrial natriuretic peptide receptor 1-like [Paramacrobiotus metropolitanus]|uniref:atrial natriuretic peptide receptor 1-like n=1 Tax=Paramacrobiotus metropolitanus TaxID=2943436 RepID=UPI002445E0DC|nr:atrial natriuretic peptide receptor 1-like [Paramacrobiotus metropolitanus]